MLSLNNIKPNAGSKVVSKRVGRGNGSGKGTYSGRGMNGQNSRSGGGMGPWFEGGQTPLFRRMPKLKGFSNAKFATVYSEVNVGALEVLAQNGITEVTAEVLAQNGLIRNTKNPVKLLGNGELTAKLTVKLEKASKQAIEKIQKAGGTVELI